MKYHDKKFKKCKYCDREAKRNITPKGRNKGHYRTCGSKKCLSKQYSDNAVNAKKSYLARNIKMKCEHCKNEFVKSHFNQRWCPKCVPDKKSRMIMQRYRLSRNDYLSLKEKVKGICPICQKNKANFIDHCHKTGKVRGIICSNCNMALHSIENTEILKRAIKYLKGEL